MKKIFHRFTAYLSCIIFVGNLVACAGDPLQSGLDPFAPMVFKEGTTTMPLAGPNKSTTLPFYVSNATIFKFAIDTSSILIGGDGVTRYIVVITNPSGGEQIQYEGKRYDCGSKEGFLQATVELALKHPEVGEGFKAYLKELALSL